METIFEFKPPTRKSAFWVRISENENRTAVIFVSCEIAYIFTMFFPHLLSPDYPWKQKDKSAYAFLPNGISKEQLHLVDCWCRSFGSQHVWPRMYSAPVCQNYDCSDLNVCIAADMNFAYDDNGDFYEYRTDIGEAVYKLKNNHCTDQDDWDTRFKILCDSLNSMLQLLKSNEGSRPSISNVPISNGNTSRLGWQLAKSVATMNGLDFIDSRLQANKPQIKNATLEEKIQTWNSIYTDTPPDVQREQIENRIIVIIDDLYQSGTTMLAYATFLRKYSPAAIYGLACVKTRGDRDNT